MFFRVDFSSTGASLGGESETELDGLRWAGRAQRGEASREARGICSFCSHLVDQRIVQQSLPAGHLPGVTEVWHVAQVTLTPLPALEQVQMMCAGFRDCSCKTCPSFLKGWQHGLTSTCLCPVFLKDLCASSTLRKWHRVESSP